VNTKISQKPGKLIIYDLGANNGDDIEYYLLKADVVVAVEANPFLCSQIRRKFQGAIQAGRVILENCVVTDRTETETVPFYLHKSNHVLSQLPRPTPDHLSMFEEVVLPAKTISELIRSHGTPYYVKIDIEHYDANILRALFSAGIYPAFVSAEAHSSEVFALLVASGGYNAFKLVDGRTVSEVYRNRLVVRESDQKKVHTSFPWHAAGPFGNDIDGKWMTADNFLRLLALEGLGWKDIHATRIENADPYARIRPSAFLSLWFWREIKTRLESLIRRILGLLRAKPRKTP
jgi:FkbM family methyltransferase